MQLRQDAASAIELASRRHLDGLIIDCDDVQDGKIALTEIRKTPANKDTPLFAVVNRLTSNDAAIDLGANFVLSKPVQAARLRSILYEAVRKMEGEHRRYFRYEVELPVRLENSVAKSFRSSMQNISQGGLSLKQPVPAKPQEVMVVEFELPSIEPHTFHAKAEMVWNDAFRTGLRFLYVRKESGQHFDDWLRSLEAQVRFRHPNE